MDVIAREYPTVVTQLLRRKVNMLIDARPGMGMIYTIKKSLEDQGKEYVHLYLDLLTSPYELFEVLEDNKDKVIIVDMGQNAFTDDGNSRQSCLTAILRAAMDQDEVTYRSMLKNSTFKFTGTLIFAGHFNFVPLPIRNRCFEISVGAL